MESSFFYAFYQSHLAYALVGFLVGFFFGSEVKVRKVKRIGGDIYKKAFEDSIHYRTVFSIACVFSNG